VQLSNFLSKLEENEKVIIDKNAKTFQMPCHIKQRLHIFNAFRKQVTDLFCLITFIVTKPSGLQHPLRPKIAKCRCGRIQKKDK
jgi:hypothetical protein